MTYWRAVVERPDGEGGWTEVAVFGTPETPGDASITARHLHGDTALEAAKLLLDLVWPVDLAEFNKREDPGMWAYRREAKNGLAGHRISVEVDESHRWSVPYDRPVPQPQAFTVAELLLDGIRADAAALAAAKAKVKDLTEQLRKARGDVRHYQWQTADHRDEAARAGVAATDIAKAARPPRQPRGSKAASTPN